MENITKKEEIRELFNEIDNKVDMAIKSFDHPMYLKGIDWYLKEQLYYGNEFKLESFFPIMDFRKYFNVGLSWAVW